ncbi:MAG: DUF3090 family protein [bacterium]|nr:DUF3090 family protein [bacterium]
MSDPFRWRYGRVDRFFIGAIGPPGQRTFYLYLETASERAYFPFEKNQAKVMGEQSLELAANLGWEGDSPAVQEIVAQGTDLPTPLSETEILFRVSAISMRIDAEEEITMMLEGQSEEKVTFTITPRQLQAGTYMALQACRSGRPICRDCQLPQDPDGHYCPAGNGHRIPI